jgi:hypothetical protein
MNCNLHLPLSGLLQHERKAIASFSVYQKLLSPALMLGTVLLFGSMATVVSAAPVTSMPKVAVDNSADNLDLFPVAGVEQAATSPEEDNLDLVPEVSPARVATGREVPNSIGVASPAGVIGDRPIAAKTSIPADILEQFSTPEQIAAEPSGTAPSPVPSSLNQPQPVTPSSPRSAPVPKTEIFWGANVETYFSSWSDNFGNNGNQLVVPFTVTANSGNLDVGVRTAFINSNFNGVLLLNGQRVGSREGSVSTLSDTSVSLAYTIKDSQFPVRLNLDMNLPTGRATLFGNEKNAIMDGSLVQQTRFGEGFNIAPGISVSHALSPNDVIGLGASYIVRGQFNPLGDVVNSAIDPGDEAIATLQYQHSDQKFLVTGGLIYTSYGVTTRNNQSYYRNGDRLDANLLGMYVPSPGNRIQLNARYFTQAPNDVVNFFNGNFEQESKNSNGNAFYLGLDWGISTDRQQRGMVHLLADYLTVQSNSYDRINDLFNGGRDKFSLGVGYDYAFDQSTHASVQVKYFQSMDRATPLTRQDIMSSGWNLYGTVNFNF